MCVVPSIFCKKTILKQLLVTLILFNNDQSKSLSFLVQFTVLFIS